MEVNAEPANRRPSTATLPEETLNVAVPRLPAIALKPARVCKAASFLLLGGRTSDETPMIFPALSRTVIETVMVCELGLTIAAAVVKLVSSQMRVLVVADTPESGTTGR
jgi:hypothetical protein